MRIRRGGGRSNSKNIVVSRPENALNKGKSPNFDTTINTSKTQQNYGKNESLICSKNNNISNSEKTNLEQNFLTSNDKTRLKNNYINIKFFSLQSKSAENKTFRTKNNLVLNEINKNYINITLFGFKQTQESEDNTTKIKNKTKLFALIFSLFFIFSTLLTSGVFLIVNYVNKSNTNATTETNYITNENLFNTNGTINPTAARIILDAVGYYGNENNTNAYTAHNIEGRVSGNTSSTIVFAMGYVNGTSGDPLYWQATYLYKNYLTIWLTKNYTISAWNASSVEVSYDTYATSTIQTYINGTFYPLITQSSTELQSIFATPETAGYQILKSGTSNDTGYPFSTSDSKSKFDNMSTTVGNSHYMWLPSLGEVCNNTSSSYTSSTTSYTGLWGLNSDDRFFNTTNYDGSTSASYCWLRSGYSGYASQALEMLYTGSVSNGNVTSSNRGVRPAAHVSLSKLAENVDFKINTTVNNDTMGTTTGDGWFSKDGTKSATIIATPNYGYAFNYWQEESTGNKIYNNPYTFTVTRHETYIAYFYAISINITTENAGAEILYQIADNTTTTYNFAIKFNTSNYLTQIKFTGDSVPRTIKSGKSSFLDVANCTAVDYTTNTDGSKLYISVLAPTDSITITLYFANTAQNYKVASGGGIETVAVQSTLGGSAELVGDDYENLTTGDTITVAARFKLNGYKFDGWYVDGVLLTTNMSARLTYDDTIKGKVIVAKFSKITSNTNTDTNNSNDFV